MHLVHALPCVVCTELGETQTSHTQAHHVREGQGMSQRAQDWLTIPLCEDCHTGRSGIHGDRSRWRLACMDEMDALAWTIERMANRDA